MRVTPDMLPASSLFGVLPASCRQNEPVRDRKICRRDAGSTLDPHHEAPLNRYPASCPQIVLSVRSRIVSFCQQDAGYVLFGVRPSSGAAGLSAGEIWYSSSVFWSGNVAAAEDGSTPDAEHMPCRQSSNPDRDARRTDSQGWLPYKYSGNAKQIPAETRPDIDS